MIRPKFPVNTITEFASLLGMPERSLWHIAKSAETSYSRWQEPKASGGVRNLSSPMPRLKEVQKKLHKHLFSKVDLGPFAQCGIKRKSNITNACEHHGCDSILTFDLRSFFPSVRPERVKRALVDELGCPAALAVLITKLVTVNYQLPQGAPTSTDIANIVTLRLQRRLYPLAKQWGIKKFTIYADDITFSGDRIPPGFKQMVIRVVREEGFKIHSKKGGIFDKSKEQIVTGINITHCPSAGKVRKSWRAEFHRNRVRLERGEISREEYETIEMRFASRMVYAKTVRKTALKLANRRSAEHGILRTVAKKMQSGSEPTR